MCILYAVTDEYSWYWTERLFSNLAVMNNDLLNVLYNSIKRTRVRSSLILSHTVDMVNKEEF